MKSKSFELKHDTLEIENSQDSLTSITGEFGRYQKIWCSLTALTSLTTSLLIYSNKFLTTKVNSNCDIIEIGLLMKNCKNPIFFTAKIKVKSFEFSCAKSRITKNGKTGRKITFLVKVNFS